MLKELCRAWGLGRAVRCLLPQEGREPGLRTKRLEETACDRRNDCLRREKCFLECGEFGWGEGRRAEV